MDLRSCAGLGLGALVVLLGGVTAPAQAERLASTYADAIRKINEAHVRRPGKATEDTLQKKLPAKARNALKKLLTSKDPDALVRAGEAALELCLLDDFQRVSKALRTVSREHADRLGTALVRPRFLLRGLNGIEEKDLEAFAKILDAVLHTYDRVFGFADFSKVPGKRIRVRVRRVDEIKRPPYFDPSPPFHSAIDFPVISMRPFRSPTPDGKFLFYGICHELGHLIAMWGDRRTMADHHAWAHYTGVVICEALSADKKKPRELKAAKDARRRSLEIERKEHEKVAASLEDRDGVMALLVRLHDGVGPKAIGRALNLMDEKQMGHRINHVRYYGFKDLRSALLEVVKGKKARRKVERLLE